jgi:hypothetical protein
MIVVITYYDQTKIIYEKTIIYPLPVYHSADSCIM